MIYSLLPHLAAVDSSLDGSSFTGEEATGTGIHWGEIWNSIVHWITTNGLRLLIGLVAVFVLFKIINLIAKSVRKKMEKRNVDLQVRRITYSLIRNGGKVLVLIAFLGFVGIDTAGIAAAVASISVGIGLALQGSLSNIAGGLIILVMRPFKIGDYITAQGESGTVEDIHTFYTSLVTPDNRVVMIPNGVLANGVIINVNMKDKRRVDFSFDVDYGTDLTLAKKAILEVLQTEDAILNQPEPFVRVHEYKDSSVKLTARVWTKTSDYWPVYFSVMEKMKTKFDELGITIPFPQLDVHIDQKKQDKSSD